MSITVEAPVAADSPRPSPRAEGGPLALVMRVVRALASLRLTVVLFSLSMVLVFFGTLAQVDKGIWTVVDEYFRSWFVWIPFQLAAEFGKKFFELPESTTWNGSFPFPGGWLIGGVMLVNLLAAHLIRFKLRWNRAGILLIHAGVIILMGGELVTGLYAVESRMVLQTGEQTSFIDHSTKVELAIIDESGQTNRTVTVPQSLLKRGGTISHPDLPFDVRVSEFLKNTDLHPTSGGDDSDVLVRVDGVRYRVVPASEESGVKSEREDAAAVRITLLKKGIEEVVLPERLMSLWQYDNYNGRAYMSLPVRITADGKTYRVLLRNQRIPKPYTVELLQFEHKQYAGTTTPKDFASTVHLRDPETGEDWEQRIWMNHPLRHRGETFYQASTVYGDTGTVLQVVRNPGWLLPYLSCAIVTLGMLVHFGSNLRKFTSSQLSVRSVTLEGASPRPGPAPVQPPANPTNIFVKLFPWAVVGALCLYAAGKAYPSRETYKENDLTRFGAIPVLDGGRVKPLDTIARTHMLFISGRSDFEHPDGSTQPAILWLLEVMAAGNAYEGLGAEARVFRIDNEELQKLLGLTERPGLRYSLMEIRPKFTEFYKALAAAQNMDEKKRELFHAKVIQLAGKLRVYQQLAERRIPTLIPAKPGSEVWVSLADVDEQLVGSLQGVARQEAAKQVDEMSAAAGKDPHANPALREQMIAMRTQALLRDLADKHRGEVSPAADSFAAILRRYKNNEPRGFSEAIDSYTTNHVYPLSPSPTFRDTTRFEQKFNAASPFFVAAIMYVLAGVMIFVSWLGWTAPPRKAAWGLALVALGLHLAGLIGRMYIMGRPGVFVTNLYSSALMIGFGAVLFCLIVEYLFRNGVGIVVGGLIGATTVKIAHHLSTDGNDNLNQLVAVLDTNFWLATHVTTITLGYAATYVAGLMGIIYILWGVFSNTLDKGKQQTLGKMTYGVVCFATLLSFVGTVLGGIWADQSWGRFWGWDPKENGAVLIVIWNSLILHARWCGLVKQRGVAVLSIVGIMVTTWSWFGTNQLGVGLHNYGFNKTLAEGCMYTWIASLVLIGIGLIPQVYWRSYPLLSAPASAIPVAPQARAQAATPQPAAPQAPAASPNGQHANGQPQPRTGKKKRHGKR